MNLLEETIRKLNNSGYIPDNVKRVIVDGVAYRWEDFAAVADFEYDPSYGEVEINHCIYIVMDDSRWFERESYDGHEWWSYRAYPRGSKPATQDLTQSMLRSKE